MRGQLGSNAKVKGVNKTQVGGDRWMQAGTLPGILGQQSYRERVW